MKAKHFFTDIVNLNNQTSAQSFGPIDNLNYNLTSLHSSTQDQRAYAVCKGSIFVQRDNNDTTLLNLLLKPQDVFLFGELRIKYFLYKGIRIDSLVDSGDSSKVAEESLNDLTRIVWEYTASMNEENQTSLEASIDSLGLQFSSSGTGDHLKSDSDFIDEAFDNENVSFGFPIVSAGHAIGMFANNGFGFEIILEDFGFRPAFKCLREHQTILTVPDLSPLSSIQSRMEDNKNRQLILNYMDPLCFYSMLYPSSIEGYQNNTIDQVLGKFAAHGRIYIDVRNESSSYFNAYGNYGDLVKMDLGAGPVETNFRTNEWPIKIIENSELADSSTIGKNIVKIALPVGDNIKPLVYQASNSDLKSFPAMVPKHSARFLKVSEEGNYTSEVTCVTSNNSVTGINNVSRYIKLFYIRQFDSSYIPDVNNTNVLLSENTYMDSLFPMDIAVTQGISTGKKIRLSGQLRFVDAVEDLGFSGMVELGICEEADRITFFTLPIDVYENNNFDLDQLKPFVYTSQNSSSFYDRGSTQLRKIITRLTVNGQEKKVISISEVPSNLFYTAKHFDSVFSLTISKPELLVLQASASSFDATIHRCYIAVDQVNHLEDDSPAHHPYAELSLGIQGMSGNGVMSVVSSPVTVLTNAGTIMASSESMDSEPDDDTDLNENNPVQFLNQSSSIAETWNSHYMTYGTNFRFGRNKDGQKHTLYTKEGIPASISDTDPDTVKLPLSSRVSLLKMEFLPVSKLNKRFLKALVWYSIDSYNESGFRIGYIPLETSRSFSPPRVTPDFAYDYPSQLLEAFLFDLEWVMYISDYPIQLNSALINSSPGLYGNHLTFHNDLHEKIDTFRDSLMTALSAQENNNPVPMQELYGKFSSLFYTESFENVGRIFKTNTPFNILPASGQYFSKNYITTCDEFYQMVIDTGVAKQSVSITLDDTTTSFQLKNLQTSALSSTIQVMPPNKNTWVNIDDVRNALREIFGLSPTEEIDVSPITGNLIHEQLSGYNASPALTTGKGYSLSFCLRDDLSASQIASVNPAVKIGTQTFVLPISYNWFNRADRMLADEIIAIEPETEGKLESFTYKENDTGAPLPSDETQTLRKVFTKLYAAIDNKPANDVHVQEIKSTAEYQWVKDNIVDNDSLRATVPMGHRVFCEDSAWVGIPDANDKNKTLFYHNGSLVSIDQSLGVLNSNPVLSTIYHELNQADMIILYPKVPYALDTHDKSVNKLDLWEEMGNLDDLPVFSGNLLDKIRMVTQVNYHLPLVYVYHYLQKINA